MAREIGDNRKAAYYLGLGLAVLGLVLFVSALLSGASNAGRPAGPDAMGSLGIRMFAGLGLAIVGAVVRSIGARGVAGSGVVLDPERAREDLEPYSRMAGGMVRDALDEAKSGPSEIVKIKCRACGKLSDEDSKFCRHCGAAL